MKSHSFIGRDSLPTPSGLARTADRSVFDAHKNSPEKTGLNHVAADVRMLTPDTKHRMESIAALDQALTAGSQTGRGMAGSDGSM